MIYLTFNDTPGGVYYSQVTDVIRFLRSELQIKIRLVAFISIRNFISNRKKIKRQEPFAIVLPMFPGVRFWKCNLPLLFVISLFFDLKEIIGRGPFATCLALALKKRKTVNRVCFDARGAYDAEFNEYHVINDPDIKRQVQNIERKVLYESDYRISVSEQLVDWWRMKYDYKGQGHAVNPCTLNTGIFRNLPEENIIKKTRQYLQFSSDDVVLLYSGSSAGWQSFEILENFFIRLLEKNEKIKIIFLTGNLPEELKKYEKRIVHKWVAPEEVQQFLLAADYGLLIRKKSVTNKVSSPTKFAEYLASGLPVLISEEIGDYTDFVREKGCGMVVTTESFNSLELKPVNYEQKKNVYKLATEHFTKQSKRNEYSKALNALINK